jgi:DNA repair protein RecN (Recombination protein N)
MIQQLFISNYALIDKLEINFSPGLTIITGETGAGKSVLLGALALILGQRADSGALQDKSKKCTVESVFDLSKLALQAFFEANDLDYENSCTIRREISPEGKSRAFVNDTPVNLTVLKELGEQLIDIHSQHQTLTLSNSGFQLSVLDAFAGNEKLLKNYRKDFKEFTGLEKKLQSLIEAESASKRDLDYYQFQFNELEEGGLDKVDMESLEAELEMLNNSEHIKSCLGRVTFGLQGGDINILSSLNELKGLLATLTRFGGSIASVSERLNSVYIELKDIADELEAAEQGVVFESARVEELTGRLDTLYRLLQKHQVKNVGELLDIREGLSNRLLGISSLETEIKALQGTLKGMRQVILSQASTLSEKRKQASLLLGKEIKSLLGKLGMPDANVDVRCDRLMEGEFNVNGQDRVNFFFSANKGGDLKELGNVASGGELSRLMLSIKSIISQKTALPSVIFDEIDTGVSGDVADKVGTIMEKMATGMQVVTITHLPQIASKGREHLFVYKESGGSKTVTRIRVLKPAERVQEIAKMLSAGEPGPAALKNAKELLDS